MKALCIASLCIILSIFSYGQKSPVKFGDIPMEDLQMTSYPLDSSASAIILCDYGEAYLTVNTNGANLIFERHVRIKVLKKGGESRANATIPLWNQGSSEERVTDFKAKSYNLVGGKIIESEISKDGVFKEKFNRYINLQKFTIPNAKEGSVLEYSYKIYSPFIVNFPNWNFQTSIPTRHSEYWAIIPDVFEFEKYMQGYIGVTDYQVKSVNGSSFQSNAHHWTVKDVPAFKDEPFMTSENDYISKINFALAYVKFRGQAPQEVLGSWQTLNNRLLENEDFGTVIERSGFLKTIVADIVAGTEDPLEKITRIHTYVKNNVEWDGYADYQANNLRKVMELKKGSSGDINLILGSMLDKAGFTVEMILLSTRDHGFIRQQYPMTRQFNYTICSVKIDGKTILLDATDKYLPYTTLPTRCLNGVGMIVSKTNHGWINIETKSKSKTSVTATLSLSTTGDMKGTLNFVRDGYDAHMMRKTYLSKGEPEYVKDFIGAKSWQVEKSEFKNINEVNQLAKEDYSLTISEHAMVAGDVIYVNPFVADQITKNPFVSENREYPVDFGSMTEKIYIAKLNLPEGYVIEELPQSKVIQLPGNAAKYSYNASQVGNSVSITSVFQINRNMFVQTDYPFLREFYNQVVAKQAEQIVLKKKL